MRQTPIRDILRNFVHLIDRQVVAVVALSLIATYACWLLRWTADIPTNLIAIALVFPIGFSIQAAYRRREEVLGYWTSFTTQAVGLYYAHRDWVPGSTGLAVESEHVRRVVAILGALAEHIYQYFLARQESEADFHAIYQGFSDLSRSIEGLRTAGVPATEISRANNYLRGMMFDFERMRNVLLYRTPRSLRAYTQVFLNAFPILFGPYFAFLMNDSWLLGFMTSFLYSLILASLDNVQDQLENPYDQLGQDDIRPNASGYFTRALGMSAEPSAPPKTPGPTQSA
jgi:predicted membrane chloride channel (bestrophin family)